LKYLSPYGTYQKVVLIQGTEDVTLPKVIGVFFFFLMMLVLPLTLDDLKKGRQDKAQRRLQSELPQNRPIADSRLGMT